MLVYESLFTLEFKTIESKIMCIHSLEKQWSIPLYFYIQAVQVNHNGQHDTIPSVAYYNSRNEKYSNIEKPGTITQLQCKVEL